MSNQFRTSLNGFNKQDVVAYLQDLTEQHRAEILALKNDISSLKEDNKVLHQDIISKQQECTALQLQLENEAKQSNASESYRDKELSAYRRAEETERLAQEKANAILASAEQKSADLIKGASERAEFLTAEAEAKAAALISDAEQKTVAIDSATKSLAERLNDTVKAINGILENL